MSSNSSPAISSVLTNELGTVPKCQRIISKESEEKQKEIPQRNSVQYILVNRQEKDATSKQIASPPSQETKFNNALHVAITARLPETPQEKHVNSTKVIYVRPSSQISQNIAPPRIEGAVGSEKNTRQCSQIVQQNCNAQQVSGTETTDERIKHLTELYKTTITSNRVQEISKAEKEEPKSTKLPGTDFEYRTPGSSYINKNGRIKRPMNAFMVWARDVRGRLAESMPNATNSEISVRLGELWGALKPHEKQYYYHEAERIKHKHREDFPDWVYKPGRDLPPPPATAPANLHEYNSVNPAPIQPKPQTNASEATLALKSITTSAVGTMVNGQSINHKAPPTVYPTIYAATDRSRQNGAHVVEPMGNGSDCLPRQAISSTTKGLLANKIVHGRIDQNLQVARHLNLNLPSQLRAPAPYVFTARPTTVVVSTRGEFVPLASQFLHSRPTNLSRLLTEPMAARANTARPVMLHPSAFMKSTPLPETRIRAPANNLVPFAIYHPPVTTKPDTPASTASAIRESVSSLQAQKETPEHTTRLGNYQNAGNVDAIKLVATTHNSVENSAIAAYTQRSLDKYTEAQKPPEDASHVLSSEAPACPPMCARGRPPKRKTTDMSATVGPMVSLCREPPRSETSVFAVNAETTGPVTTVGQLRPEPSPPPRTVPPAAPRVPPDAKTTPSVAPVLSVVSTAAPVTETKDMGQVETSGVTKERPSDNDKHIDTNTNDSKDWMTDQCPDNLWPFPFSEYPSNSWLEEGHLRAMFYELLDADDPFFYDSGLLYSDLYPGGMHLDVDSWQNYIIQKDGTDEDPCFRFKSQAVEDINVSPVPLSETLCRLTNPIQDSIHPETDTLKADLTNADSELLKTHKSGIGKGNAPPNEKASQTFTTTNSISLFNENCNNFVKMSETHRHEIDRRLGNLIDSISEPQSNCVATEPIDSMCNREVTDSVDFINSLSASIQSLMNAATYNGNEFKSPCSLQKYVANKATKDSDIHANLERAVTESSKRKETLLIASAGLTNAEVTPVTKSRENIFDTLLDTNAEDEPSQHIQIANTDGTTPKIIEQHNTHDNKSDVIKSIYKSKQLQIIKQSDGETTSLKKNGNKEKINESCKNAISRIKDLSEERRAHLLQKLKDTMEELKRKMVVYKAEEDRKQQPGQNICSDDLKITERNKTKLHTKEVREGEANVMSTVIKQEFTKETKQVHDDKDPATEDSGFKNLSSKLVIDANANDEAIKAKGIAAANQILENAMGDRTEHQQHENLNTVTKHVYESFVNNGDINITKVIADEDKTIQNSVDQTLFSKVNNIVKIKDKDHTNKSTDEAEKVTVTKTYVNQASISGGGDFIKKKQSDNFTPLKIKVEYKNAESSDLDNHQGGEVRKNKQRSVKTSADGSGDFTKMQIHKTIDNLKTELKDTKQSKHTSVYTRSRKANGKESVENSDSYNKEKTVTADKVDTRIVSPCKRQRSATNLVENDSSRRRLV